MADVARDTEQVVHEGQLVEPAVPSISASNGHAEPSFLSWEDIQSRAESSVTTRDVWVEEWNGTVKVRGLFLDEARDVWERSTEGRGQDGIDAGLVACYTVAYGCVTPRIPFDQAKVLGRQGAGVIFKLFQVIDRLTGVSEAEVRRAAEAFRES